MGTGRINLKYGSILERGRKLNKMFEPSSGGTGRRLKKDSPILIS
jgi:hypothetical protein